jgi:hypothetical protein
MVRETVRKGGTLFFCGNGGSAADAQHLATEYVVRYARARRAYPAIALTTDSSLLTAAANDLGFEEVFARQIEALAKLRRMCCALPRLHGPKASLSSRSAPETAASSRRWPRTVSSYRRIARIARRSFTCASNT